jgi:hypothetical protein
LVIVNRKKGFGLGELVIGLELADFGLRWKRDRSKWPDLGGWVFLTKDWIRPDRVLKSPGLEGDGCGLWVMVEHERWLLDC